MNKKMKIKILLILINLLVIALSNLTLAATVSPRYLDLSLTINPITRFDLTSSNTISVGQVVPNYDYQSKPLLVANDPWRIAAPMKIQVYVENNTKANIYVYTDHQRQNDYWNLTSAQIANLTSTTNISGLVNVSTLSKDSYLSTVSMLAWVDWLEKGSIPTDPNDPSLNWVYVLDKMGSPLFSTTNNPLPLLADWQTVLKRNLDIYILTCWDQKKFSGNYQGRLFLTLDQQ